MCFYSCFIHIFFYLKQCFIFFKYYYYVTILGIRKVVIFLDGGRMFKREGVEHQIERGRSGPEAGQSAVRTVRACGPDGPRVRRTD
jgi:hypothetical protein